MRHIAATPACLTVVERVQEISFILHMVSFLPEERTTCHPRKQSKNIDQLYFYHTAYSYELFFFVSYNFVSAITFVYNYLCSKLLLIIFYKCLILV